MPYATLANVTVENVNGDVINHPEGTVLSDWEVADKIRRKISEGAQWYRSLFEPLTEDQAHAYRIRATVAEDVHVLDGNVIDPPFDDYIGLHPEEITQRLRDAPLEVCEQARRYERAGFNRAVIVDFVHPAERAPFRDYDELPIRELIARMDQLNTDAVSDIISYESAHKKRPAIISYERPVETAQEEEPDGDTPSITAQAGAA